MEVRSTPSVLDDNKTTFASSSKDTQPLSPSLREMPPPPPGLGDMPSLPPGFQDMSSHKVPPLEKQSQAQSPAPPMSRAQEAKQWSRKRDVRGDYYVNSVTGETQSETPDCLKKYSGLFWDNSFTTSSRAKWEKPAADCISERLCRGKAGVRWGTDCLTVGWFWSRERRPPCVF